MTIFRLGMGDTYMCVQFLKWAYLRMVVGQTFVLGKSNVAGVYA